jgi:hypothetical protein
MNKQLEIGKDYGIIFGLDASKGMMMIYQGGISWMCIKPGAEKIIESQGTTDNAIKYISAAPVHCGTW